MNNNYLVLLLVGYLFLVCFNLTDASTEKGGSLTLIKQAWIAKAKTFGDIRMYFTQVDSEGNFYSAMGIEDDAYLSKDTLVKKAKSAKTMFVLAKYKPDKTLVWYKTPDVNITTAPSLALNMVLQDEKLYIALIVQSGIFKIGTTQFNSTKAEGNTVLLAYNTNGGIEWTHYYQADSFELLNFKVSNDSVVTASRVKGTLRVDGTTTYTSGANSGTTVEFVSRIQLDGTIKWTNTIDYKSFFEVDNVVIITTDYIYYNVIFAYSNDDKEIVVNGVNTGLKCVHAGGVRCLLMMKMKKSDGTSGYITSPSLYMTQTFTFSTEVYNENMYVFGGFEGDKLTVGGVDKNNHGERDVYFLAYNSNSLIFGDVLGGTKGEYPIGIAVNDNGVFLSLLSQSDITIGGKTIAAPATGYNNVIIVKYKTEGTFEITDNFVSTYFDYPVNKVIPSNGDHFYMTFIPESTSTISTIARVSGSGKVDWHVEFTGTTFVTISNFVHDDKYTYLALSFGGNVTIPSHELIDSKTSYGATVIVTLLNTDGSTVAVSDVINSFGTTSLAIHDGDLYWSIDLYAVSTLLLGDYDKIQAAIQTSTALYGILSNVTDLCLADYPHCESCSGYASCGQCSSPYVIVEKECRVFCYGLNNKDKKVCSGKGNCINTDRCCCANGWAGHDCKREKNDNPYYYNNCWVQAK
jgi:hypothetical protein